MKNKIIKIGCTGMYVCFLNMSEEDAKFLYCKKEEITIDKLNEELEDGTWLKIESFEFDISFSAYDVYSND